MDHGVEEEDPSVEDVVVSMQCNNPQDKVQQKCSKLQHNRYKVNKDKWDTTNADDVRATVIGLMIVHRTVKAMEEVVEEDICVAEQDEEDEEEEESREEEEGIRQ